MGDYLFDKFTAVRALCREKGFLFGLLYGFALWALAKPLFGHAEPWDGNVALYVSLLTMSGFVCVFPLGGTKKSAYWSLYLGQAVYGFAMLMRGSGDLFPLGAIVLLAFNLPALLGAWLADIVSKRSKKA